MDSAQALHNFWSSFSWKAYDATTVPAEDFEPSIQRVTYEVATGEIDYPILLTASLWDKSFSWATISQKAKEIFNRIGKGGVLLPYDGGAIWITRGSPFSQRFADEDDTIRRILINVNAEFLSA